MNLFELFVKIGVDDQASGKLSNLSSKLGNGLKTAAKIGTAAVGAAAAGITALTTAAVNNYAEYEQLVGGAELMFGKAYDTVAKNAQDAYKTVQMSQNEYLQQVNGFATGLKTALGGNEQAAAELAHNIVQAEADIIAATGNTAENVQNAFNGIMKSNFTMLDNLQIGITPTKEGFQEVIDKVNEWNKANGEATNYQMGNLADMQSALVDYIDMVGMSGYAQREASETITGSLSSMKAAWTNLVTGFADDSADLDKLIGNLTDSVVGYTDESGKHVKGVLDNLLPAIEKSLGGIAKLIEGAAPKIIKILPGLVDRVVPSVISAATGMVDAVIKVVPDLLNTVVDALIDNAPALIAAAIGLVQSLIQGIQDNYQILVDGAIQIVTQLATGILNMLPQIVKLGLDLIVSLANGIAESLPELIPTIVDVILQIVDTLTDSSNLSNLIDASIAIIFAIANGLIASIPKLLQAAPKIVQSLVNAIIENVPKLLQASYEAILSLVDGIGQNLPQLVTSGLDIVSSVIEGIVQLFGDLVVKGADIVDSVKEGFFDKVKEAKDWGKDMIQNFIDGIVEKWESLKETVKDVAESIKDRIGFSEPKLGPLSNFHTYAPDMMDLFIKGIRENEKRLTDQVEKSFDLGKVIKNTTEYEILGSDYTVKTKNVDTAGIKYATNGNTYGDIIINVNGARYENERSLANEIAETLRDKILRKERVYA